MRRPWRDARQRQRGSRGRRGAPPALPALVQRHTTLAPSATRERERWGARVPGRPRSAADTASRETRKAREVQDASWRCWRLPRARARAPRLASPRLRRAITRAHAPLCAPPPRCALCMEGHFRTCIHVGQNVQEKADDGALGDPASLYVRVVVPCDGVNSIVWSIGDAYWSEVQNPEVRASYQTWRLMSPRCGGAPRVVTAINCNGGAIAACGIGVIASLTIASLRSRGTSARRWRR